MARSGRGTYTDGVYRPQRAKGSKKGKVELFRNRSVGLVDRLRRITEQNRDNFDSTVEGDIRNRCNEMDKIGCDGGDKQRAHIQFNKGRPPVDREERRGVKRNLFGDRKERSSVNRKLMDKLKIKKKSLRKRQAKHLYHKQPPDCFNKNVVSKIPSMNVATTSPFFPILKDSPRNFMESGSKFSSSQSSFSTFHAPSKRFSPNPVFLPFSTFPASSSIFTLEASSPARLNFDLSNHAGLCSTASELPFPDTTMQSFVQEDLSDFLPTSQVQFPDSSSVDKISSFTFLPTSSHFPSLSSLTDSEESSQWWNGGGGERDSPIREVVPRIMWGEGVGEMSMFGY